MKNFELFELKNSEYDYLVIATTYISPILNLDGVQNKLIGKSGKLIFDLTLINGINSNRYISALIESGIVNRSSFDIVKNIKPNIENKSSEFFIHHSDLVKNGTISDDLKLVLLKNN